MLGFKGNAFVVEEDRHRTVIDLIGDGEGGVVVVRRADEPDVLLDVEFAFDDVLRVVRILRGDEVDVPFKGVRHFHDGEEFGEVILDTRQVHFVEDD